MASEFAIKVRREGEKQWLFLGSGGRRTWLRIHACRFYERATAQLLVDRSAPDNPGTEWKVVKL